MGPEVADDRGTLDLRYEVLRVGPDLPDLDGQGALGSDRGLPQEDQMATDLSQRGGLPLYRL